MKCPHCNRGTLENPQHIFQYDYDLFNCSVCSRGWHQDKKGNWHSHFATDIEIYSKDGQKMLYNSTRDGPTIPAKLQFISSKLQNQDGIGDSERAKTHKSLNCRNDETPSQKEREKTQP